MSQGGSRRPYSRGGPRWHQRYKEYWDYEQNFSEGSGSGSPKELAVSPKPAGAPPPPPLRHYAPPPAPYPPAPYPPAPYLPAPPHHHHYAPDAWRHGPVVNTRRADRRRAAEAGGVAGSSRDPLMATHLYHHTEEAAAGGAGGAGGAHSDPADTKRPALHRAGDAAMNSDRRPPRRHYQPMRRGWEAPLLIDINQMQYRNARLAGWREPAPAQGGGEVWTAVLPHLRYHPQAVGAGPLGAFPAPHLAQRGEPRVESEAARDLLLLRAEGGGGLELLNPHARHHLHHHRSGGVRARTFRPPRYMPAHHYHQGAGGALLTPVPPLVAPPPTYQVFLNLLAMFPVGGGSPPWGGSPPSGGGSPPSPTNNYEQLLTLAERLGEDKPRGLTQRELDALPLHTAHDSGRGCGAVCVVCMAEVERRAVVRSLPCAHRFHADCVDRWLRSNRTCPICRGVVGAPGRAAGGH